MASWSAPALAAASIALMCFEPDPAIAWGPERIGEVRQALVELEVGRPA